MTYELAKQLKDAGFPQEMVCYHGEDTLCDCAEVFMSGKQTEVYLPTLEELIEACGEGFQSLTREGMQSYSAFSKDYISHEASTNGCEGKTPSEAVAKLWLELNKK